MYKKLMLALCCILLQLAMSEDVTKETLMVRYDINYRVHLMGCAVDLNNKNIFNTANIDKERGFLELFTYTHGVTQYMNKGENLFNIRVDDAAYFLRPKEKNRAYCEVTVTAIIVHPETEEIKREDVFNVRFTIKEEADANGNKKPVISTEESMDYRQQSLAGREIKFLEKYSKDIYKDGSVFVTFPSYTRTLRVNHDIPLSWVNHATPVKDTPEIRRLALDKYKKIRIAIENREWDELKELLEPGLTDMATIKFMTRDEYFNQLREQLFNQLALDAQLGWKADPSIPEGYKFVLIANGKLFSYYYLRNNEASPVSWEKNNQRTWFSSTLTYINGQVKVAAF